MCAIHKSYGPKSYDHARSLKRHVTTTHCYDKMHERLYAGLLDIISDIVSDILLCTKKQFYTVSYKYSTYDVHSNFLVILYL